jgi:HD-like signal output (HDOD) protein
MIDKIIRWFNRCFGIDTTPSTPHGAVDVTGKPAEQPPDHEQQDSPIDPDPAVVNQTLPTEAKSFLLALLDDQYPNDLHELSLYDHAYISEMLSLLGSNAFEIPLLPEGAVRIQNLIADPRANAADFVGIFKGDPALSAALIKMVNSPFYGSTAPIHDLQLAVSRVGLNQIQGLVIMMSLQTRILRGKALQREVEWLTELSLHMAMACQQLASAMGISPGEAFTRGLLHHVEYFAILGVSAQYISTNRGEPVSAAALIETIRKMGSTVRQLVISTWGLDILELQELVPLSDEVGEVGGVSGEESQTDMSRHLDELQRILIEAWSGNRPEPVIEGFDTESVRRAISLLFPEFASKGAEQQTEIKK